jgi:hypothetical protein
MIANKTALLYGKAVFMVLSVFPMIVSPMTVVIVVVVIIIIMTAPNSCLHNNMLRFGASECKCHNYGKQHYF